MKSLFLALAVFSPTLALAQGMSEGWSGPDRVWHWYPGHDRHGPRPVRQCVHSRTFVTGSRTEIISACEQRRPLLLANKESYFPNLRGGSYHVDYWDGAYAYRTRTVTSYQIVVSNDCSGETLSSEASESVAEGMREFAVENPNLDPGIKASFELSPLLPEEADAAFAKALTDCQAALAQ